MFHVKHGSPCREQTLFHVKQLTMKRSKKYCFEILLPYTELPENHIQDVLDVDTAQ